MLAQDLEEKKYTKNIRAAAATERAGGYVETIGCLRALQEAMAGLYFMPVPAEPPEIILENWDSFLESRTFFIFRRQDQLCENLWYSSVADFLLAVLKGEHAKLILEPPRCKLGKRKESVLV